MALAAVITDHWIVLQVLPGVLVKVLATFADNAGLKGFKSGVCERIALFQHLVIFTPLIITHVQCTMIAWLVPALERRQVAITTAAAPEENSIFHRICRVAETLLVWLV